MGGWDGTSHYAMAEYYNQNIFPDVFGWTHNWNAGMVWPLGYPPFFHIIYSILRNITPFIDSMLLFKLFFVSLNVFFPLLGYFIARKLKFSSIYSLLVGLLFGLFQIAPYSLFQAFGVTMTATFQSGLYTQFLSSIFFFVLVGILAKENKTRLDHFGVIIFFSMVLLTNIHAGEASLILLFGFFVVEILIKRNLRIVLKYFLYLLFAFGLISFWSFPLLETSKYFPSMTFEPILYGSYLMFFGFLILGFFGCLISLKEKKFAFVQIYFATVIIFLVSILPIKNFFPDLPVQPGRLIIYVPFLSIVFLVFLLKKIFKYFRLNTAQSMSLTVLFLIPLLTYFTLPKLSIRELIWRNDEMELVEYLSTKNNGRTMYEVISPGYPLHYNLSALSGLSGQQTIWNVFRESSLNSPYIMALRNSFSRQKEYFGVACFYCLSSNEFEAEGTAQNIKRANIFNLNYIAVTSVPIKKTLLESGEFELDKNFDNWFVLEKIDKSGYAETLENKPILLFTEFNSKSRDFDGPNSYNWQMYNEEWFKMANFDIFYVYPRSLYLDDPKNFENFSTVVVEYAKFKDFEKAVDVVSDFLVTNKIIIINSKKIDQALLDEFRNLKSSNLIILEKSNSFKADYIDLENELIKIIDNQKIENNDSKVAFVDFSQNGINIQLDKKSDTKEFVYVKSSFFPYWKDQKGGNVYLASPSLMLVDTNDNKIELNFERSDISRVGGIVSLITFIILLLFLLSQNKKFLSKIHPIHLA